MDEKQKDKMMDEIGAIIQKADIFDSDSVNGMLDNLDSYIENQDLEHAKELAKIFIKGTVCEQVGRERLMRRISGTVDKMMDEMIGNSTKAKKVPVFDKGYEA